MAFKEGREMLCKSRRLLSTEAALNANNEEGSQEARSDAFHDVKQTDLYGNEHIGT